MKGQDYDLPGVDNWQYAPRFLEKLNAIKTGSVDDPHGWIL